MDQGSSVSNLLSEIDVLNKYLKSEMYFNEDVNHIILASIRVSNIAPVLKSGGDVVFVGVGLRIIGREPKMGQRPLDWRSMISKTKPSPQTELRNKYDEGYWYGARDNSTTNELSIGTPHGETLFPGESIEYTLKLNQVDLPYLNIKVEGSISRLHLFHVSQPMVALNKWTQPVIDKAFLAMDSIDFFSPLISLTSKIPEFNPQTTISDIQSCKNIVTTTEEEVKKALLALKDVDPPNTPVAKWMEDLRQYLKSFFAKFKSIQDVLNGNDTSKMKVIFEEYKSNLVEIDGLKLRYSNLKTQFERKIA
jgi:hypothetical protein